jgi:hypothetical protein
MAQLSLHPAPGLNDLLPGWYAVPQNPVEAGLSGISYTPSIGEILPAVYVVPQNPLKDYIAGRVALIGQQSNAPGQLNGQKVGVGGCGCGCGGSGACGGHGMGDISTDFSQFTTDLSAGNFSQALSDPILGVPSAVWMVGAAAALLLFTGSTGPSRYQRARRAYSAYRS